MDGGSTEHLAQPTVVHVWGRPGHPAAFGNSHSNNRSMTGIESDSSDCRNSSGDSTGHSPGGEEELPMGKDPQGENSWPDRSWSSSLQHLHKY